MDQRENNKDESGRAAIWSNNEGKNLWNMGRFKSDEDGNGHKVSKGMNLVLCLGLCDGNEGTEDYENANSNNNSNKYAKDGRSESGNKMKHSGYKYGLIVLWSLQPKWKIFRKTGMLMNGLV